MGLVGYNTFCTGSAGKVLSQLAWKAGGRESYKCARGSGAGEVLGNRPGKKHCAAAIFLRTAGFILDPT
jgi:hypothetical protein